MSDDGMISAIRRLFETASEQVQRVETELVQEPGNAGRIHYGQFWICWTTAESPTADDLAHLKITSYAVTIWPRVEEIVGQHLAGGIVIIRFGWKER